MQVSPRYFALHQLDTVIFWTQSLLLKLNPFLQYGSYMLPPQLHRIIVPMPWQALVQAYFTNTNCGKLITVHAATSLHAVLQLDMKQRWVACHIYTWKLSFVLCARLVYECQAFKTLTITISRWKIASLPVLFREHAKLGEICFVIIRDFPTSSHHYPMYMYITAHCIAKLKSHNKKTGYEYVPDHTQLIRYEFSIPAPTLYCELQMWMNVL